MQKWPYFFLSTVVFTAFYLLSHSSSGLEYTTFSPCTLSSHIHSFFPVLVLYYKNHRRKNTWITYAIILSFLYAHHIFWLWAPSLTALPCLSLCILLKVYTNKAVRVPFECGIINYTRKHHSDYQKVLDIEKLNCTRNEENWKGITKPKTVITRGRALQTAPPHFQ